MCKCRRFVAALGLGGVILSACGPGAGTGDSIPTSAEMAPILTRPSGSVALGSQLSGRGLDGNLPVYGGQESLSFLFSAAGEDLCALAKGQARPRKSFVYVAITAIGGSEVGSAKVGTYTVNESLDGGVIVTSSDNNKCADGGDYLKYDSGSVTITELGSASTPTQGSIDLVLRDGAGTLKGPFTASACLIREDDTSTDTSCR